MPRFESWRLSQPVRLKRVTQDRRLRDAGAAFLGPRPAPWSLLRILGARALFAPAGPDPRETLSYGSVVILTRQRGLLFLRVLPSLVEDLLDVVGRSYDGVDYVVLDDVHETILDPGKSDHALAAVGVVAQTPCDVVANPCLHTGLAEVDVVVAVQLKGASRPPRSHEAAPIADQKIHRSEAIHEVSEFAQDSQPGRRDSNLCISKSSKWRIWTVSWSPQAVQWPYCIIRDAVVRLLAAPTGQSVSNAYGIGSRRQPDARDHQRPSGVHTPPQASRTCW
jgi:hypothetical protein